MSSPFFARDRAACYGATFPMGPRNTIILGGRKLPGITTITAEPARDVTVEKAPGRDGGEIIDAGYVPAQVEISLKLWTDDQWSEWQSIVDQMWPAAGKVSAGFSDRGQFVPAAVLKKGDEGNIINQGAKLVESEALAIEHPRTNVLRIDSIVIVRISAGEPGPEPQSYVFTIKAAEWKKPPPPVETKKVSGKTKVEDPVFKLGPGPKNAQATTADAPGKTGGTP